MTTSQWLAKRQAERRRLEAEADKAIGRHDVLAWRSAIAGAHFVDDIIAQFLGFDHQGTEYNA